jgi:hypothetical protein
LKTACQARFINPTRLQLLIRLFEDRSASVFAVLTSGAAVEMSLEILDGINAIAVTACDSTWKAIVDRR